jgi:hypothetical protein
MTYIYAKMSQIILSDQVLQSVEGLKTVPQIHVKSTPGIHLSILAIRDFSIYSISPNVDMDDTMYKHKETMWTTHLGPCVGILVRALDDHKQLIAHSLSHDSTYTTLSMDEKLECIAQKIDDFKDWLTNQGIHEYAYLELYVAGGHRAQEDASNKCYILAKWFPECNIVYYDPGMNYPYPVLHRTSPELADDYTTTTMVSGKDGQVHILVVDPYAFL